MAVMAADANCSVVGYHITAPFSANGADIFYKGGIVYIDAAGGVQNVPAAADKCLGVTMKQFTTTAAGDLIDVLIFGAIWVPIGTNIAAEDEGDPLMMDIGSTQTENFADCVSAGPEGDVALAEDDILIGRILRVTTAQMLIFIGHGLTGNIGAATPTNAWG